MENSIRAALLAAALAACSGAHVPPTLPAQQPVIAVFNAAPVAIAQGQSTTLTWTTSGATSLSINGGLGDVTGSSSKTGSPSVTTVYTLTATNAAGSTSKTAEVTVVVPGVIDATVAVDTSQDHRAISPYVYGYNASTTAGAPPGATWLRLGGNRWTAYNWTNNYSNAGSDYGPYHNDTLMGSPADGPGHAAAPGIDDAKAHGVGLLVTIPIQGWVSKDASGNVDPLSPLTDHFAHNQAAKGSAFTTTPSPTSDPVFQDEFAAFVAGRWGAAAGPMTGPIQFSLDNEPDLWSSTHAEVQRSPLTYAALLSQSIASAAAIKKAVPTALIYGPASYGYAGYLTLQSATDASTLGDFLNYYLDQMNAASSANGHRLLDVLDLHFYSEAQGCGVRASAGNAGNGDCVVAARVQSPRSLWDPTYKEQSWITACCTGPAPASIQLVPRMLAKIAAHYPATRLAITEYNHGGSDHISGAVAQADTLGALGREGVYAASYWALLADNSWAAAAWRAFRGYDAAGKNFGDTSVLATSSDVAHVAAYASVDSAAPNRVVLVLVHRPGVVTDASGAVIGSDGMQARSVKLQIAHPTALGTVRAWQLAPGAQASWQALSPSAPSGNALTLILPALSVTTVELTP
jgi:Glycoside hydrolase family 44